MSKTIDGNIPPITLVGPSLSTLLTATTTPRSYTIPDTGGDATFKMDDGINDMTIVGTTNRITANTVGSTVTLSTPQDIATTSSPTFSSLALSNSSNQLTLGNLTLSASNSSAATYIFPTNASNGSTVIMSTGTQQLSSQKIFNTTMLLTDVNGGLSLRNGGSGTTPIITLAHTTPSVSRIYTLPDAGADSNFVMTEGAQTINGAKTFASITANTFTVDTNFTSSLVSSAPRITFDVDDYLSYNRTSNQMSFVISGTSGLLVTSTGAVTSVLQAAAPSNQIILRQGATTQTINASPPAAARITTIPDAGANSSFILSEGTQTINGTKTFTNIKSNLFSSAHSCYAHATMTQSVSNAVFVVISATAVSKYDPSSIYNNTSIFTVPATGFYHIHAQVKFADAAVAAGDSLGLSLNKGGSRIRESFAQPESNGRRFIDLLTIESLTAGDLMTFAVRHQAGVAINVEELRIAFRRVS